MSQAPVSDPQHSQPDQRSASGSSSVNTLALVFAALIAAMLQFAAFAKLISADPRKIVPGTDWLAENTALLSKPIIEGYFIGILEMAIVMLILIFHRWRHTWTLLTIFFIGMAGFGAYAALNGRDCGCFGDVIKLPRGFTVWMNLGIAGLSLLIMRLKGIRAKGFIVTLVLSAAAFGGGWVYGMNSEWPSTEEFESDLEVRERTDRTPSSDSAAPTTEPDITTDPTDPADATDPDQPVGSEDQTVTEFSSESSGDPGFFLEMRPEDVPVTAAQATNAARTLVASNLMTAERRDDLGTAYYLFIHDPACNVCEQLKPMIFDARDRFEEEGNPFIQVREFSVPFLFENLRIQHWAWESTPTVIVVKDGTIIHESAGATVPVPEEIEAQLMSGELE